MMMLVKEELFIFSRT